jgi:DNA-directed RNA polymerase
MLTEKQIEDQQEFERKQISGGLHKLMTNTKKLEDKDYASATVYGSSCMKSILPDLIAYIDEKKDKYLRFNAAKDKDIFHKHILPSDSPVQALIATKIVFDMVFSPISKKHRLTPIAEAVGKALEAEAQMEYYENEAKGLFITLKKNYWHQARGTESKRKCIQTTMHKQHITPWVSWAGEKTHAKVGIFFLECLCEVSGWFIKELERKGRKTYTVISPSELLMNHHDEIMRMAKLFSPLAKPMLIPPRNWHSLQDGGYYLNDLTRCHQFIRRSNHAPIQGEIPYQFINKIQQVSYKLNPFIVKVAKELEERGISVGKFRPIIEYDIPPKPPEEASKETWREWRSQAGRVHTLRKNETRKACRTKMTMEIVREFEDKVYYIPWSFDYRGRVYPIPNLLTPQDTDFGKSLILFNEGAKITEKGMEWIKFQLSTSYGLSKATMQERLEWVDNPENHELCCRIVRDPITHIADWENADEPWLFLAAAEEYIHLHYGHTDMTYLPVAVDATCSGLQILAGLAKDASTARMVNVLGSEKPQDAYATIASRSMEAIPERLRPYWDRKATKRCVMTIPYNAKPFSNRSYIREAFKDKDVSVDKEELTSCVSAVRAAMNEVVPGAMRVMKWIETEVARAIKAGAQEIQWTTPSGFVVKQRLMKVAREKIQCQLMGRISISVAGAEKGVDLKHHKNATAPNLIHSLDAALLHLAIKDVNFPIALIHDSVLCRATDMCKLSTLVRKTYMTLFAEHEPLTDFALAIGAEEQPPIIGDLKPEAVIDSQYFFC